jgi:NTE family protein
MSAGFFGFYGHTGFLQGLRSAGLEPAAYAGTSAGGMVAAFAASGLGMEALEAQVLSQTREGFWDPDPLGALRHALAHGFTGLLRGEKFRKLLDDALGADSFEGCAHPLVLVAADLTRGGAKVFTRGALAPAVHATCAYPGLFRAVHHDGSLLWDGGLVDKAPLLALADSEAGRELDAYLVHYLPSRTRESLTGAFAYVQGMSVAMAALRRDHFRLQTQVLQARGIPVYVVSSELPSVSPSKMSRGSEALAAGRRSALDALRRPAEAIPP